MKREIVKIDDDKCNGCGLCVPNCHEGALQIIDNKAVLISDLLCDGLGACVGHCPQGAITIEVREAEAYDEIKVMQEMVSKGKNVVIAHLKHLKDHNETSYLNQGLEFLKNNSSLLSFDANEVEHIVLGKDIKPQNLHIHMTQHHAGGGCPGSRTMSFAPVNESAEAVKSASQLSQWPVQLHLINPAASHFTKADLLIAADCTAFANANFHNEFLKGKKLVIACPKLDSNKEIYIEKIKRLIDESAVNTITVMIMEVPCCSGLLQMVQIAAQSATRKVPVKCITIGIRGDVLEEEWV